MKGTITAQFGARINEKLRQLRGHEYTKRLYRK